MRITEVIDHVRFISLHRDSKGFFTIRLHNLDGTVAFMTDRDLERLLLAFHSLVKFEAKIE